MTQTTEAPAAPEEMMPKVEPQREHEWLQQLVGEWVSEMAANDQGKEFVMTGTQTVRAVGDIWIVGEGRDTSGGADCGTSIISLGYDPQKQRFVGTWFGTMMTNLWVYEGTLDADERVLTLACEGPRFTDPAVLAPYTDVIEIKDKDTWTLSGRTKGDDGQWVTFCTTTHRRKAS